MNQSLSQNIRHINTTIKILWGPPKCGGPGPRPTRPTLKSVPGEEAGSCSIPALLAASTASPTMFFKAGGIERHGTRVPTPCDRGVLDWISSSVRA